MLIGTGSVFFISSNSSASSDRTLTVLNYGKYFDEDTLKQFEAETGITVKYEEYEDPEEMYTKYKSGAIDYDVICTSEYIIGKLINEGEVNEIDYDSIENYSNIDPSIIEMSSSYDPEHKYTLPYFYGTVGILYNKTMVDPEDLKSWNCLWDGKYAGNMIMINSVRDAMTPALATLGYSINDTNEDHLREALQLLINQKPDVTAYLVDETCDEMVAENAAMAICYSGEAASAMDLNENLDYTVPSEGSNIWIDSWFIPKTCQHSEEALEFLNYICRDDAAEANFEYVYYASPVISVVENMSDEDRQNEAINPPTEVIERCEIYKTLNDDETELLNTLWQELKGN